MKKAIILFATVLACTLLDAQQKSSYLITKGGKNVTTAEWTETPTSSGLAIDIVTKGVKRSTITSDKNGKTSKWHIVTDDGKSDYTVTRKGDTYTITGRVNGKKDVNKTFESEHNPWYQAISFSAGKILNSENRSINYECIRPDNGKLTTMSASIESETQIYGHNCYDVKVATTGIIAGLWSCHYFVDTKTGQFIMYQGVEGVPGTPMTQWMLQ